MKTVNLSDYRAMNALETDSQTWVPIGDGLEVCFTDTCEDGDAWDIVVSPFVTGSRLSSDIHGNHVFLSGLSEPLSVLYGNTVWSCVDSFSTEEARQHTVVNPNTRSEKMVTYFGHVFMVLGRKLFWSDLDNPSDWHPVQANEADFRVIEWERLDVTGLVVVEDQLFIHTPSSMYQAVYAGKPTIINVRQRLRGAGAVEHRTIQLYGQIQFFLGTDNFYLWSPDHGLNAIGADVWADFCQHRGSLKEIWSYHDKRNNEICWVSGAYVWAFNYLEKSWYRFATDGVKAHANVYWDTTRNSVADCSIENIWGTDAAICRELRQKETFGELMHYSTPYLETDDFTYGDLHFEKRVDLVAFDAQYGQPWQGIKVFVSARDFVTQPVVWNEVGIWEQELKLKHLDFRTLHGKVLRFKFELVHGWRIKNWKLNGGLQLNGKALDVFDGRTRLNCERTLLGRHVLKYNGARLLDGLPDSYGTFTLQSWGERVDIGTTLIGADK